jgi:AcrR family transcriptional regulator
VLPTRVGYPGGVAFTARSQPAREAVLSAARRAFATRGYDRTTVRGVAAEAGVDASMVMRYYVSKDGLFEAATAVDLALPELGAVPASERGAVLARRFVTLWDDPATGEVLTLLLRSAPTSERAADRIRDVFSGQVQAMVAGLGDPGRNGEGQPDGAVDRRAGALSSYILGTALARYVLALAPLADAGPDEVVATMAPVIQAILDR